MRVDELPTPALVIDNAAFEHNLATMAAAHPGSRLRPHVKAHKTTALARAQAAHGHHSFTCATPREVVGMAVAGLGADLLLANESVDPMRLRAMADAQSDSMITVAVDSAATIDAAADAGLDNVLIDVNVGLPRCGCAPADAGRLADLARRRSLVVRGVMGYEGHLMMVADRAEQRRLVDASMDALLRAHRDVGGDIVSSGGTGTYDLHDTSRASGPNSVNEVQAGSYALMDTHYGSVGFPFRQACFVVGTVISTGPDHAVADVGLKALGMDHGNPSIDGARVWFCSDEHITFSVVDGPNPGVGERVSVLPAHIDPTMALHEAAWLVHGDDVIDRWAVDLRGW